MTADDHTNQPPLIFYHPPDTDEHNAWALELAGDDPARRAAMTHWLGIGEGFDVLIDYGQDRFSRISVEDRELEGNELESLHLFPEIDEVEFERVGFSDEALDVLRKQKTLKSLRFVQCSGIDNGLCNVLAELPELEALILDGPHIDDRGLADLARTRSLKYLTLHDVRATSIGLEYLVQLPNLESLGMANTAIDDVGLRNVAKHSRLRWLGFTGGMVTDNGFKHLLPLNRLVSLSADNTQITDQSLKIVANFTDLYRLHIQGTKITGEGIVHLKGLTKLHDLNLRDTAIDDAAVPALVKMPWLNPLDLRGTKISKQGIERIRAALKPSAALYNDHGVHVIDRERAETENKKRN